MKMRISALFLITSLSLYANLLAQGFNLIHDFSQVKLQSSEEGQPEITDAKKEFSLADINSEKLVIEIFNLNCPSCCKKTVPTLKELYGLLKKHTMEGNIKIVIIGLGNNQQDVKKFKKNYDVDFLVFADEDLKMHELIGRFPQLYFMVAKRQDARLFMETYSYVGTLDDPQELLQNILK